MKKIFIGIDFSKETFDVAMFMITKMEEVKSGKFINSEQGCKDMLKWISEQTKVPRSQWLFCGEHTGLYSLTLASFLNRKKVDLWLTSALEIKQSQGVCRGKSDQLDARRIAMYAYRFQDKAKLYHINSEALSGLKDLMAYRNRLIEMKKSLATASKELHRVKQSCQTATFISGKSRAQVAVIEKDINEVEQKILELMEQDEQVKINYEIITSIKGIGFVNAVSIIVATGNFTLFPDPRKFSCYCGSAPFQRQSGTSLNTKNRVSHIANKKIKTLLTLAAESAIRHNKVYKNYYKQKTQQGKPHFLVVNNVRNKLIHLIFALVYNQVKYDMDYISPLAQTA